MGGIWSDTMGLINGFISGPHALKPDGENPAVVRTNVGVPAVGLLNQGTIQHVFNPELYEKEPFYFGAVGIQKDLVRGHCPSMFANDEEHRRKKALLVDVYEQCQLPTLILNQVMSHYQEWSRLEAVPDFEDRVYHVVSEALTEAVFGRKVDGRLCLTWLNGLLTNVKTWIPMPSMARQHRLASQALPQLLKAIEEAPKYGDLAQLCRTHDLEVEDGVFTILYATLFNACGAVTAALVSSVARLHTLSDTEKNDILQPTLQALEKNQGISGESLGEMKTLESFVLEVLRLHPPVFFFWALARKDFVISPEKENLEVRKGERVFGSCFWAQRDGSVFPDPVRFRWDRFIDEKEGGGQRKHLLFPRGSWTETSDFNNHQCPGQDIAFFMMKAILAVLLCYCNWELEEAPVWSDKTIRLGRPDRPVSLTSFNFNSEQAKRVLGL
ncbi:CYP7B1 [Branchiostoma lanceolatum]|uniref:sterol 22-desaturase n=1 Tax=Branchiostoma lanceolatum TaxID=7740 RepID=A0A8K0EGY5_BRALA|nr:CYP7B1 [Branchiostoma lanceolatum]